MTDSEIECFAWAFWLDEIGHFLGPHNGLTKDRVDQAINDLRTMETAGYALMAKMKPAEMESFHARALPIYIAVGERIKQKVA